MELFNGVDVDRIAAARPWSRDGDRPIVLFLGRHEERKGLGILLDAVERMPADRRPVLWIAGDGPAT